MALVWVFSEFQIMSNSASLSMTTGKEKKKKTTCPHMDTQIVCNQQRRRAKSARGVCQKAPQIISHSKQNPGTTDRPWAGVLAQSRQTLSPLWLEIVGSGERALSRLKPTQTRLKLMSPSLDKPEPDWGCCCSLRAKMWRDYKGM